MHHTHIAVIVPIMGNDARADMAECFNMAECMCLTGIVSCHAPVDANVRLLRVCLLLQTVQGTPVANSVPATSSSQAVCLSHSQSLAVMLLLMLMHLQCKNTVQNCSPERWPLWLSFTTCISHLW